MGGAFGMLAFAGAAGAAALPAGAVLLAEPPLDAAAVGRLPPVGGGPLGGPPGLPPFGGGPRGGPPTLEVFCLLTNS